MSSQLGIWSYGAQVTQPIFTGGALRGNLNFAESQQKQALIAYLETIQRAFGDVSDALIGYEKFHEIRKRQEETVADLQESAFPHFVIREARRPISKYSMVNDHCIRLN